MQADIKSHVQVIARDVIQDQLIPAIHRQVGQDEGDSEDEEIPISPPRHPCPPATSRFRPGVGVEGADGATAATSADEGRGTQALPYP